MNAPQPASPEPELLIETRDRVRTLTLNRPHRLNALSWPLSDALAEAFLDAAADPEVFVIVVTGTGDRAFCSGTDLKEIQQGDAAAETFRGPMDHRRRLLFEVIAETYKPTIAALNGVAIGAGFEVALACDIRIAAAGAKLGLPEAKIGMGGVFGSVVLPRVVPVGIAMETMFTGEFMSAEDAARWGLVNRVVPPAELPVATRELASKIAGNAPLTVRRMKEMAMKGLSLPLATALRLNVGPNPYTSEDRKEGIRAFIEKRKPQWKGR